MCVAWPANLHCACSYGDIHVHYITAVTYLAHVTHKYMFRKQSQHRNCLFVFVGRGGGVLLHTPYSWPLLRPPRLHTTLGRPLHTPPGPTQGEREQQKATIITQPIEVPLQYTCQEHLTCTNCRSNYCMYHLGTKAESIYMYINM